MTRRRRPRRGFAMLAAIWLIVAIGVVALDFALEAHDRAAIGIEAADRGTGRAAAAGALAITQARMELALVQGPAGTTGNAQALRGSDPWLGVDSLFSGPVYVDSTQVDVYAEDLGTRLNINLLSEQRLTTLFNVVLRDATTAGRIAQSIMDWTDADSIARPNGAERDQYIQEDLLSMPTNTQFRELDELLGVRNITPEIYNLVVPYLTTFGSGLINLNTADTVVIRTLPGMTDQILQNILNMRANGRRIMNVAQVMPAQQGRGGRGGQPATNPTQEALEAAATVQTSEVMLTMTAYASPGALPVRMRAIVNRSNATQTTVSWKQW
jgi:type II secretory pathway component PulK